MVDLKITPDLLEEKLYDGATSARLVGTDIDAIFSTCVP